MRRSPVASSAHGKEAMTGQEAASTSSLVFQLVKPGCSFSLTTRVDSEGVSVSNLPSQSYATHLRTRAGVSVVHQVANGEWRMTNGKWRGVALMLTPENG